MAPQNTVPVEKYKIPVMPCWWVSTHMLRLHSVKAKVAAIVYRNHVFIGLLSVLDFGAPLLPKVMELLTSEDLCDFFISINCSFISYDESELEN